MYSGIIIILKSVYIQLTPPPEKLCSVHKAGAINYIPFPLIGMAYYTYDSTELVIFWAYSAYNYAYQKNSAVKRSYIVFKILTSKIGNF